MKKSKLFIGLILCIIMAAVSIYFIKPLFNKINFGLDLQGGFEVLYEVSPLTEDDELTGDMLYNTYKAILKRIDILGVSEPEITIEGDDHIRVKLAGVKDIETARNTISSTATLSFRDNSDNLLMTSDVLGGLASVSKDERGMPAISLKIKDVDTFYEATKKVKNMINNVMVIWLDFDEEKDSYKNEVKKHEMDPSKGCGSISSHCLSAAYVEKAFASDVIIQGNFTKEEANTLVELINSGALPTKLNELSSHTVEASFGMSALNKTITSGIIGIIIVILLMIIVYRFSGFIAGIGLITYTYLTFLIFYLIEGVLTLPGIAAILLGIGMAVDANIIIFERIKENLKAGKPLAQAYEQGNKTSITSIIDSNTTTVIATIIMFILGESSVKGFSTMLLISIFTTIIVMVIAVRLIISLFVKSGIFNNKLGLFIGINKNKINKNNTLPFKKLNIINYKKKLLLAPLFIIVIGLVLFITTKANYGIDFTGGTSITINSTENINELLEEKYTINKKQYTSDSTTIYLNEILDKDEINNLSTKLNEEYKLESDIYVVSKVVKQELVKNAIKSLIFAGIGIIIYIAIRFRFNYAIGAIIALLHDILFTFLFFAVFKIEINALFIASILTIIGYSINDTIVTFDVIRNEYKEKYKNKITNPDDLDVLVNNSIRRTLTRNILTSITTIIPIIILLFFGSKEINNFNLALLIGFIAGSYSSLFIATLIWLKLEKRRILKPVKEEDIDEINELKVKGINC